MAYKIKYHYQTGSSLYTEDKENYLELTWNNLDIAKENLNAIKEHYKMYQEIESLNSWVIKSNLTPDEIFDKYKDHWWFINKKNKWFIKFGGDFVIVDDNKKNRQKYKGFESEMRYDSTMCQNCMMLKTDNGTFMQQWNPWCGYFETLYGAEIVGVDNDLKFEV